MTAVSTAEEFDVVVLGAGISGLVTASILLEQGNRRILVVDEYEQVGGNHIDRAYENYTFDVGSLIFQDDSPLLAHFPELLPRYVPIDPSWGKLSPQGVVGTYPFSVRDDLIGAGPVDGLRILFSAAFARLFRRRLGNARDYARFWIGARLLRRSGLENYMERFCGLPAERIDLEFAEKRMFWIAEHASLSGIRRRLLPGFGAAKAAAPPPNRQLARAREGFGHLYAPAVERLTAGGVTFVLGAKLQSVRRTEEGFELCAVGRRVAAPRVVSTIPLDNALDLCGLPRERDLPTVTLISLFYSFSGDRGFPQSVLYNFSHDGAWKRLTMHSDFYGKADGREFFSVEVIADRVAGSVEAAEKDFGRHTAANGLFGGDLRLEGCHVLPHAYPIYTERAGERAAKAIAALREFGIESFGRQGGFTYQPTARVSTLEAEAALRRS